MSSGECEETAVVPSWPRQVRSRDTLNLQNSTKVNADLSLTCILPSVQQRATTLSSVFPNKLMVSVPHLSFRCSITSWMMVPVRWDVLLRA